MSSISAEFLRATLQRFMMYKSMGEKAIEQIDDGDLFWKSNDESNSIETIIKHLNGNMLSRWTDFLTTDGEKPTRERDAEFETTPGMNREMLLSLWEEGWSVLITTISSLTPADLEKEVTIRGKPLSVLGAIQRQLPHTAYHVGQIVWIARARKRSAWNSLSIERGQSKSYVPSNND